LHGRKNDEDDDPHCKTQNQKRVSSLRKAHHPHHTIEETHTHTQYISHFAQIHHLSYKCYIIMDVSSLMSKGAVVSSSSSGRSGGQYSIFIN
jgi:hypothetical protein